MQRFTLITKMMLIALGGYIALKAAVNGDLEEILPSLSSRIVHDSNISLPLMINPKLGIDCSEIKINLVDNLFEIIKRGGAKQQKIKEYLRDGGNPNLVDRKGKQSLLQIFCFIGNEEMVNVLIKKGAFVPYVDAGGHSVFSSIACLGSYLAPEETGRILTEKHGRIIQKLISHIGEKYSTDVLKRIINYNDTQGVTALHLASMNGHDWLVERFVLDCHADIDQEDNLGRTALHFACYMGNRNIIGLLLGNKANPEKKSKNGFQAKDFLALRELKGRVRIDQRIIDQLERQSHRQRREDIQEDESLRAFKNVFQRKCSSIFLAYRVLESNAVQETKDVLTVSNAINIIGGMIPLPGAALAVTAAATVVEMVEDQIEARKKQLITEFFESIQAMDEAIEKASCELTSQYKNSIRQLTVEGAETLAECGIARFIAYMRDEETRLERGKPFEHYVLESVRIQKDKTQAFLDQFLFWKNKTYLETKNDSRWTDHDIFILKVGIDSEHHSEDISRFTARTTLEEKQGENQTQQSPKKWYPGKLIFEASKKISKVLKK